MMHTNDTTHTNKAACMHSRDPDKLESKHTQAHTNSSISAHQLQPLQTPQHVFQQRLCVHAQALARRAVHPLPFCPALSAR